MLVEGFFTLLHPQEPAFRQAGRTGFVLSHSYLRQAGSTFNHHPEHFDRLSTDFVEG
jgi:hypothetical protein